MPAKTTTNHIKFLRLEEAFLHCITAANQAVQSHCVLLLSVLQKMKLFLSLERQFKCIRREEKNGKIAVGDL